MRVSGFTFVRNATILDYPLEASIQSILPLVDEMIVAVGDSEDDTRARVAALAEPRIRILDTVWDPAFFHAGHILAEQTNIALDGCGGDWCVYIQADEVLHEKGHTSLRDAMQHYLDYPQVEGLLLPYVHFYGSYRTICTGRQFYRQEIRVVRNNIGVRSFRDAQGFRIDDRKLRVIRIPDAPVYHYGWTRPPETMREKVRHHWRMWRNTSDAHLTQWQYTRLYGLRYFDGTHPAPIQTLAAERAEEEVDPMALPRRWTPAYLREALSALVERLTGGWRIGEWKNFKELNPRKLRET